MPIRVVTLEGSLCEMGGQHGSQFQEEIHALAEERLRLSLNFAANAGRPATTEDALSLARDCVEKLRRYSSAVYTEFLGIADGARISPERLLIANGYTDYRDALAQRPSSPSPGGCTSLALTGAITTNKRSYLAQTWDMDASAERFVLVFRRKPKFAPQSLTLTTTGCLSLIGINEAGIAVGNNNLIPTDARPGVIYLALIHNALAQCNITDAVRAITDAERASGHHYLVIDSTRIRALETTAAEHEVLSPNTPAYVHTNHYLSPRLRRLEATGHPSDSSLHRLRRMEELLRAQQTGHSPETIRKLLSDHDGGELGVCRHNHGSGVKTCAAAILCPWTLEMLAVAGNPCEHELELISLES